MRFEDKIILVTGGNSGIGLATAKKLAAEGAKVVITGRDGDKLDKAVLTIGALAYGIAGDTSCLKDLDRLFSQIKEKYGRLDGVFANAGIVAKQSVQDVSEESYDNLMDINVKGVFFTIQKAIPLLSKGASIVVNSSSLANKGTPATSVYAASKAAVRSFARTFSGELLPLGIRVNTISPGPVNTPIWSKGNSAIPPEGMKSVIEGVPMKRLGEANEVANVVVFLLSSESSFIAGEDIHVDGGKCQI